MTDQFERIEQVPKFTKDRLIRIESKLSRFLLQWEDTSRRLIRIEKALADLAASRDTPTTPQDQEPK